MFVKSHLLRAAVAAAALCCAPGAFAQGQFIPELGFGYGSGGAISANVNGTRNTLTLNTAFGYRFDNGLGVRAMFFGGMDPFGPVGPGARAFDQFTGIQATAYLPLAEKVKFMGAAGIGDTQLKLASSGHDQRTEGVLSAGLQATFVKHYAMELRVDYLTQTHERNIALMAQVPF